MHTCMMALLLSLLYGTARAVDMDLWLRVERVDSLCKAGRPTEALAMGEELLPVVMEKEEVLSEARLRLILSVVLRSVGMEQESFSQLEAAGKLVETPQFERMDRPTQRQLAATILTTLAMSEMEKGHTDSSVRHARLSIKWARRMNDKSLQAFVLPFMGHVLLKCGKAEEALPILEEGRSLAHQLNLPQYEKVAEQDLAEMRVAKGQDTPAELALTAAMDETQGKSSDTVLAHVRDTVVKKVVVESKGGKPVVAWWQHRQVLYASVVLFILLLMLGGAYLLRQRRFRRRINQLKETSESRYLEGKEEERNRLAKEMHDGVSNQLLAIEMKLQSDGLTPQTMQMLSESREQVRRVSHELMPPDFEYATLDDILRNYVEELDGAKGCELTYRSQPEDADWASVPKSKALGIYRIVQEAVGNALKHSDATQISVVLQWKDGISVTVANDGMQMQPGGSGIGLRTMQQRADAIGGTITMQVSNGFCLFMLKVE